MEFKKIDNLKKKLDSYRPLPKEVVKNLHEEMVLKWTYNSNAIEGNTLTLKETKVALEGITIGGKTLKEHFEVINHREAILFVEELAKENRLLTERDIKGIHSLVLKNIDVENAGRYRKNNVIISGAEHLPPNFLQLEEEMKKFIKWYEKEGMNLHPVERAIRVHVDFVGIHPFIDGNGRTARLLMNLELIKSGFPPVILNVEDRLKYYESLDLAHTKQDYRMFIELMIKIVEESFKPYFYALGIEE